MESRIAKIQTNGFLELEKSHLSEDKWAYRKRFASVAINLWLLAEGSDSYKTKLERGRVLEFIKNLFITDSLFPPEELDENKRKEILLELVGMKSDISPITEVCDFVKKNKELSKAFFYDACLIAYLDGRVVNSEQTFLSELEHFLGLTPDECSKILVHFSKNN